MTSKQIFPYGPNSRLMRALLYTHTSKTTKSQCFRLLFFTVVQPVHTPVRTQANGPDLSQSNISILSVFCLVYNNKSYCLKITFDGIQNIIKRKNRSILK